MLAAHPLMALRTLALPGGGPQVKTALSTRLTSSVRDMSVGSVRAAAALSAFAEEMAARTGGLLRVTRTLGAVTAGSPDLAALLRESPRVHAGPGERVVPVAALPGTGLPASPAWLAAFTRLALGVGLRLLELGVALEAHGQNLLVVLSPEGEPLRLVYRDLADIRVGPARLARHGIPLPRLPERILTDDVTALRRKLFGSLVAGGAGGDGRFGPGAGAGAGGGRARAAGLPRPGGAARGAGAGQGADLDAADAWARRGPVDRTAAAVGGVSGRPVRIGDSKRPGGRRGVTSRWTRAGRRGPPL
ncbi:hypothetical protein GCM10020256_12920 [Streptomyces thermocoprophilus]